MGLKFIIFSLLMILSGFIGSYGFHMPNSSAADIFFGLAVTLAMIAFGILVA